MLRLSLIVFLFCNLVPVKYALSEPGDINTRCVIEPGKFLSSFRTRIKEELKAAGCSRVSVSVSVRRVGPTSSPVVVRNLSEDVNFAINLQDLSFGFAGAPNPATYFQTCTIPVQLIVRTRASFPSDEPGGFTVRSSTATYESMPFPGLIK